MRMQQLSIERNILQPLLIILAEVAATAHHHLVEHILIIWWVPADEVLEESGSLKRRISYQLLVDRQIDAL